MNQSELDFLGIGTHAMQGVIACALHRPGCAFPAVLHGPYLEGKQIALCASPWRDIMAARVRHALDNGASIAEARDLARTLAQEMTSQ